MLKRYKSDTCVSFTAHYGKQRWFVEFRPNSYGGSEYITSDANLQKAIENSAPFRNGVVLLSETAAKKKAPVKPSTPDKPSEPAKKAPTAVKGITTGVAALNFLKEHGYVGAVPRNREALKKKALGMGYEFVDLIG